MAYRDEDLEAVDYDRMMTIHGFVMDDIKKNKKRDRSKFNSDAEYRVYLEDMRWSKMSSEDLEKISSNNA